MTQLGLRPELLDDLAHAEIIEGFEARVTDAYRVGLGFLIGVRPYRTEVVHKESENGEATENESEEFQENF